MGVFGHVHLRKSKKWQFSISKATQNSEWKVFPAFLTPYFKGRWNNVAQQGRYGEGLARGGKGHKRTYWTTYNCLPMILPHVSTARLEQPVEKIPVYFQKQIKAFRLCSANLSLKAAGKICSLPLSLTPRPLQVRTFRPASLLFPHPNSAGWASHHTAGTCLYCPASENERQWNTSWLKKKKKN